MTRFNACMSLLFMALIGWQVYLHIPYQLCYLEHTNLFVGDWDWFIPFLKQFGGIGKWLGMWGIQFFNETVTGVIAFILPVIISFVAVMGLMQYLGKQMSVWVPIATGVSVCLLLSLFDSNFYWSGACATALALLALWLLTLCRMSFFRHLLFLLGIPLITWTLGAISCIYILAGVILFANKKKWMTSIALPLGIYAILVTLFHLTGLVPNLKSILSPAGYYESMSEMPLYHVCTWGTILLVLVLARLVANVSLKQKMVSWTICCLGWLIPSALLVQTSENFSHSSNQDLWRLNHYAYMEKWDAILEFLSDKPMNNYLFMNYANMALAHQGELANRAFYYHPKGMNSLLATANATGTVRLMASDVHYSVGCIAEAQQHAFEAQVTFPKSIGIQTMKRLVKTNLIFGHYEVAEKYLSLIAQTTFHKDWATKYRQFINNDKAIEADAELGEQRRNLSKRNRFAMFRGWTPELEDILESNPDNQKALEYLGLSYLMNKDLKGFQAFMEKYYGARKGKTLPLSFQQAVMALDNQDMINAWGISASVKDQYRQFMRQYTQNRQNPNLKNVMSRSFGHTVWYYLIFV